MLNLLSSIAVATSLARRPNPPVVLTSPKRPASGCERREAGTPCPTGGPSYPRTPRPRRTVNASGCAAVRDTSLSPRLPTLMPRGPRAGLTARRGWTGLDSMKGGAPCARPVTPGAVVGRRRGLPNTIHSAIARTSTSVGTPETSHIRPARIRRAAAVAALGCGVQLPVDGHIVSRRLTSLDPGRRPTQAMPAGTYPPAGAPTGPPVPLRSDCPTLTGAPAASRRGAPGHVYAAGAPGHFHPSPRMVAVPARSVRHLGSEPGRAGSLRGRARVTPGRRQSPG